MTGNRDRKKKDIKSSGKGRKKGAPLRSMQKKGKGKRLPAGRHLLGVTLTTSGEEKEASKSRNDEGGNLPSTKAKRTGSTASRRSLPA